MARFFSKLGKLLLCVVTLLFFFYGATLLFSAIYNPDSALLSF